MPKAARLTYKMHINSLWNTSCFTDTCCSKRSLL